MFFNHPHKPYKYQVIHFAPSNVEIMTNSLFQPIWSDFYEGLNLSLRVNSAKCISLIVPNWPKCQTLNPHNCMKNYHR